MRNTNRNRGNNGSNNSDVERDHQNRHYYANEDSDIYENEFQNEEMDYDDGDHFNDLDWQYRNAIDREEYEHQLSMGYISNNPNRIRKPSKRRYPTDRELEKLRRNHYIMQNLGVTAKR